MKIHCENGMGREVNPNKKIMEVLTSDMGILDDINPIWQEFENEVQPYPTYLDGKPFMGKYDGEGEVVTQIQSDFGWINEHPGLTVSPMITRAILAITPPVEAQVNAMAHTLPEPDGSVVTKMGRGNYCTLTDTELVEKAEDWVKRLINTGGRDWSLPIPANPNKDVDLILSEVIHRFKKNL